MQKDNCTLNKVFTYKKDTSFLFASFFDDKQNEFKVIGVTDPVPQYGRQYFMLGENEEGKNGGEVFHFTLLEEELPITITGIKNYLINEINGIGEKTALSIVDKYGLDTFSVFDDTPEKLLEIEGIGEGKKDKIIKSWKLKSESRKIMVSLASFGVSSNMSLKLAKTYGVKAVDKIKENPYIIAQDVSGIGFLKADEIARKLGFSPFDKRRIIEGIKYTLLDNANSKGNTYINEDTLKSETLELLRRNIELSEEDNSNLLCQYNFSLFNLVYDNKELINDNGKIALPLYYNAEKNIAYNLKRIFTGDRRTLKNLYPLDKEDYITYDKDQISAINSSIVSKVSIITGGPGVGKTTILKRIVSIFKEERFKIILSSPTGRASKRMSESIGAEALTIHRLLNYSVDENGKPFFKYNKNNKLSADVIILDECSMIDTLLFSSLLDALPDTIRLIMVGDVDQLPSVGAGKVFKDLIDSALFPVSYLKTIHRQDSSSLIVTNAHRINEGKMPYEKNYDGSYGNYVFFNEEENTDILEKLKEGINEMIQRGLNSSKIQVLTPSKKGMLGTMNLNSILQSIFNPNGKEIYKYKYKDTEYSFRLGDKVMQKSNNYEKDVFNGDMGIIMSQNEDGAIYVDFGDKSVLYEKYEFDNLTLSYAQTIHKSQGSEYPVVFLLLDTSSFIMLKRNLFYTGVTRAKNKIYVIGQKKAVAIAVSRLDSNKRNTLLKERLQKQ